MLLKVCFHPDPLTHFDPMSLNKPFFFEGVPYQVKLFALKEKEALIRTKKYKDDFNLHFRPSVRNKNLFRNIMFPL